ncbi:MAG: hypothetical protein WC224_02575 [Sphaerochaetaceae bacterium]
MRKAVFFSLLLVLLIPMVIGARSLGEVDLGLSGIYHTQEDESFNDFFEGMADGKNWTIGINLNARLYLFNLSFMAMIPNGSQTNGQKLDLLSTLSVDIPLVTDLLYFNLGGGLTTDFIFGDEESEASILGRPIDEITFSDLVMDSPIHFRYGLDLLIGSAKIGLFYLVNTRSSLSMLDERGGWSKLFSSAGSSKLGLKLELALF